MMGYSVAAILAIICIGAVDASNTGKTVEGWTVPSSWVQGRDYVVVKTSSGSNSQYSGYIFPGPDKTSGSSSVSYSSPDGYACEAKVDHLPLAFLIACFVCSTTITTTASSRPKIAPTVGLR
jgi:hypothetical protein